MSCASQALCDVGVVSGSDMTPEAALAKLSYVLSKSEWSHATKKEVSALEARDYCQGRRKKQLAIIDVGSVFFAVKKGLGYTAIQIALFIVRSWVNWIIINVCSASMLSALQSCFLMIDTMFCACYTDIFTISGFTLVRLCRRHHTYRNILIGRTTSPKCGGSHRQLLRRHGCDSHSLMLSCLLLWVVRSH